MLGQVWSLLRVAQNLKNYLKTEVANLKDESYINLESTSRQNLNLLHGICIVLFTQLSLWERGKCGLAVDTGDPVSPPQVSGKMINLFSARVQS